MSAGSAWYWRDREGFLEDGVQSVVGQLATNAVAEGLHVEPEQHEEWNSSIGVLQRELRERAREVELLRATLASPQLAEYRHVLLEYDFRRRGLRIDCVLLGEFHEETRRVAREEGAIVAATRSGSRASSLRRVRGSARGAPAKSARARSSTSSPTSPSGCSRRRATCGAVVRCQSNLSRAAQRNRRAERNGGVGQIALAPYNRAAMPAAKIRHATRRPTTRSPTP